MSRVVGIEPRLGWLQTSLRPDWIIELQRTYLSSVGTQFLATLGLVGIVAVSVVFTRYIETFGQRRYGSNVGEALRVILLAGVTAFGIYAFSVVWHMTYLLRLLLNAIGISRWTLTQQLITIAVIFLAYLLVRLTNRSIDKLAQASSITQHQSEVAYHVADVGIALAATSVLLTLWGINLTNVFIGAGAITALIGLAARATLAAMIAGFILLFSRPFRVGDWIEVNDSTGIVKDVTIFNTKVQTFDDKHVLIPNDQITSSQLTNLSRNDQLRVDVEIGVDYETDIRRAREIIVDAVEALDSIKNAPDPQVVARRFGDSAVVLELRVWIGDPTMRRKWQARTDAIEAVKDAFEREGITIPFPQRVHTSRDEAGLRIEGSTSESVTVMEDD